MVDCPVCGEDVENSKICPNCGSAVHAEDSASSQVKYCINCGERMDNDGQFCSSCGYDAENDVAVKTEADIPKKPGVVKNTNTLYYIIGIVAVIIVLAVAVNINTPHGNTTINGIDFNIPDGYIADMQKASWFESGFKRTFPYDNMHYELQVYTNGYEDIAVVVINAPINSDINNVPGQSMSIKGHQGKLSTYDGTQTFCYIYRGKAILIAGDMDVIDDVII